MQRKTNDEDGDDVGDEDDDDDYDDSQCLVRSTLTRHARTTY